ncbi:hypothetical protein Hanom_Chr09g00839631 [Helianthus anomalus]
MHPFNRDFVPPRSSGDTNQMSNPSRPVSSVSTGPNSFGSGFVDYNQHQTGFMNLLNHPSHGTQIYTIGTRIKNGRNLVVSSLRLSTSIRLATTRARRRPGYTTGRRGGATKHKQTQP